MVHIYHITHLRNLPSILSKGGLCCDGEAARLEICDVGIAYDHIKQRRARHRVPIGPGGVLTDYVPFYFAPRSPMLYAIHTGHVEHYQEGQEDILYLVSSVKRIQDHGLRFVFTDGHAVIAISRFYSNPQDLSCIDWPLMENLYWADTDEDPDRKRRRQAEFLVHQFVPISCFLGIGVMTQAVAERVSKLLGTESPTTVRVKREWYY